MTLIPKSELPLIAAAIGELVQKYGHPDEIPVTALAECGIDPDAAEKCFALLTSEVMPDNPAMATAKWLRIIGDYSA